MTVLLIAQNLGVYLNLGNLLKGFRTLCRDEELEKYGCNGRVVFDLVFG